MSVYELWQRQQLLELRVSLCTVAENSSKSCVSVYELWQRMAVRLRAVCQFMNCDREQWELCFRLWTVAENNSKNYVSGYELWQKTTELHVRLWTVAENNSEKLWQRTTVRTMCQVMNCSRAGCGKPGSLLWVRDWPESWTQALDTSLVVTSYLVEPDNMAPLPIVSGGGGQ